MQRTVALIQCRFGSSRLPGKALRHLAGRPMLAHVIERVLATVGVDEVVLATSVSDPDAALLSVAGRAGVRVWRGSEWDVLTRMSEAAHWAHADVVMRVTGDCPFWDPVVGARVLAAHLVGTRAYTSNDTRVGASGYPDGLDTECFSLATLDESVSLAHERQEREHVTTWMRGHRLCALVTHGENLGRLKLSVDTINDFAFATAVVARLDPGDFSLAATVAAATAAGGYTP